MSSLRLAAFCCVLVSLAGAGIKGFPHLAPEVPTPAVKTDPPPECPSDSLRIPRQDTAGNRIGGTIEHVPLSGGQALGREYNDCQAFVDQSGTQYVGIGQHSLFAIFAADPDSLAALMSRASSTSRHVPIRPDRRVHYSAAVLRWMRTLANGGMGYPFATIHDYGTEAYAPLGIKPGFNCLYVWVQPSPLQVRARMVSQPMDSSCMRDLPNPAAANGKDLAVAFQPPESGLADSSIPAVGRWDWDAQNKKQYAGLKCGPFWCEVGDSDLVTSQDHRSLAVPFDNEGTEGAEETKRVRAVKGWYDEEQLAVMQSGQLQPSGLWGAIFPHPLLNRSAPLVPYHWRHVVTIFLHGDTTFLDVYRRKLGLDAGMNKISLCAGAWAPNACYGNPSSTPTCHYPAGDYNGVRIWSRVTSKKGVAYHCVMPRVYMHNMPGAARWRWSWTDQTSWIRCPTGCCEVEPN